MMTYGGMVHRALTISEEMEKRDLSGRGEYGLCPGDGR